MVNSQVTVRRHGRDDVRVGALPANLWGQSSDAMNVANHVAMEIVTMVT